MDEGSAHYIDFTDVDGLMDIVRLLCTVVESTEWGARIRFFGACPVSTGLVVDGATGL